jgi:hypothetical protein
LALTIQHYTEAMVPAVRAFNARIAQSDAFDFGFPESPVPAWLPRTSDPVAGAGIHQDMYVALDDSGAVRGGYVLKHQLFTVAGQIRSVGFYRAPVSEGIADKRYASMGAALLRDALRREKLLFSLGIGSREHPLSRLLLAMKWTLTEVPFFFRIERGARVFRELRAVRTSALRRLTLDVAAFTGAALAPRLLHGTRPRLSAGWRIDEGLPPAEEIDSLFHHEARRYSFCAVRTRAVLDRLYELPNPSRVFLTIINPERRLAGWAVVLNTPMRDDKYFGNLRVGSIVDTFAAEGAEPELVAGASAYLREMGAELIVSNQSHREWIRAMQRNGFRMGPSNYLFAASPALWTQLGAQDAVDRVHLLRADGDGPIHL